MNRIIVISDTPTEMICYALLSVGLIQKQEYGKTREGELVLLAVSGGRDVDAEYEQYLKDHPDVEPLK